MPTLANMCRHFVTLLLVLSLGGPACAERGYSGAGVLASVEGGTRYMELGGDVVCK